MFLLDLLCIGLVGFAHAQDLTQDSPDKIYITADRNPSLAENNINAITTISEEDWKNSGEKIEQALSMVPGVFIASSGGQGQPRTLFLRGSNSEHVLVLVDGVAVNDPNSTGRSFDFGQIPVGDIERIEVIRGAQSVLYGSNAMGGVVQIFTKNKSTKAKANFEAGSYKTYKANFSTMGFYAGLEKSAGISAAEEKQGNTERDSYRAAMISAKQDYDLSEQSLLKLFASWRESKTDTDTRGGPGGDKIGSYSLTHQWMLKAQTIHYSLQGLEWNTTASYFTDNRDDNTVAANFYRSHIWQADSHLKKIWLNHEFLLGLAYSEEEGISSEITNRKQLRSSSLYLEHQYSKNKFHGNAGARLNFHSQHKWLSTYRAALGYWIRENTFRIKSNIGSAFKAPSLYQTYSPYGSAGLRAEKNLGWDAGLEWLSPNFKMEINWYENRFQDLIQFENSTQRYFNLDRARTYGLEWLTSIPISNIELKNSFTTTHAIDSRSGAKLYRRPLWSNATEIKWKPREKFSLLLRGNYMGKRDDVDPILFSRQKMPSYFVLNLQSSYQIHESLGLNARLENILDRNYQEISGYGTAGFSAYAGIEATL